MFACAKLFLLLLFVRISIANHYKGGTLSWKPANPYATPGPVQIIITERHSWSLTRYLCNNVTINTQGPYNDTQVTRPATVTCISSSATCTASLFQTINSPLYCTDFSTTFQISTGVYISTQSLTWGTVIDMASRGGSWTSETLTNDWSLVSHMDLTLVSGKINSSPVTASLPIVQAYVSQQTLIQILAYDWDSDQVVRCRWAYQTPTDECGSVCFDLPGAVLSPIDCMILWTPVLRAEDIANGLSQSMYVVAIMAEDFVNASSTTSLSSVPHQMLVYVTNVPTCSCTSSPNVSGVGTRNSACYAVSSGTMSTFTFSGRISSTCNYNTTKIVDFISTSPLNISTSGIYQVSNYTWQVKYTWTPRIDEIGLQPLCIASVDNCGRTSSQYCVMVLVGDSNPSISIPTIVQGTFSPLGTVMSTQSRFSVETNTQLRRTTINGTYIYIYQVGSGSPVYSIDCKYSPDVYFLNKTLVFYIRNASWTLGATYYVSFTSGVITANEYCGPEANAFSGSTAWRFTIWNPGVSSTTTPSTTTSTATTHTVTTRFQGTTTYNTLYTTTGIPAYTTTSTTSTTSTTTTSATTTTTTSATTTTTSTTTTTEYMPNAVVLYPKDLELACIQPAVVATTIIIGIFMPIHFAGMIIVFVKVIANHHSGILRARSSLHKTLREASNLEEGQPFL